MLISDNGLGQPGEARPLTEFELRQLFRNTEWSIIDSDPFVAQADFNFSVLSLFKAHSLPYLLPITSERPLAKELVEREFLQELCGFSSSRLPSRSTLWNFRDKNKSGFPFKMLKILVSMAICAKDLGISLPSIRFLKSEERQPDGYSMSFHLRQAFVILWLNIEVAGTVEFGVQNTKPASFCDQTAIPLLPEKKDRQRLADALGLPTEAFVQYEPGGPIHGLVLYPPSWLKSHYGLGSDLLTTIGSANITRSYTACSIIITRETGKGEQVLLSRRLSGFGTGRYTLPGGKRNSTDSSKQMTAFRELDEETGLKLIASRPISQRTNNYPGKPPVESIGVIALEYHGNLLHKESTQNTPWEWYDMDDLPSPLFDPTRKIIEDYLENTFPSLKWDDVEDPNPQSTLFDLSKYDE